MKRNYAFAVLFLVSILIVSCGGEEEDQADTGSAIGKQRVDSVVYVFQGIDGRSAFDLLRKEHEVDFIPSEAGVFVNVVDSLEVNSKYGWMYSVNDTMGKIASDRFITSDSDIVKWHYRKF
jgi:hypothetical protein